jgi:hypothetical protein
MGLVGLRKLPRNLLPLSSAARRWHSLIGITRTRTSLKAQSWVRPGRTTCLGAAEKTNPLFLSGIDLPFLGRPAVTLVIIPTELSGLVTCTFYC